MDKIKTDKKAFTLAEVLITLTIIGVIAALTIPNLLQSYRKHETETALKEAYSIVKNATKMAIAEHGNPDSWDFNIDGKGNSGSFNYAKTYFIPYVKIQKFCGDGVFNFIDKGCFIDNGKNGSWNYLNGAPFAESDGYNSESFATMILQNGMHVALWAPSNLNLYSSAARNILFFVDVNGRQGTSLLGKDIFIFLLNLDKNQIITGKLGSAYGNIIPITKKSNDLIKEDCNLNSNGFSCARVIELSGWKIPDDYPIKKW